MVNAFLTQKKGYYYIVINQKDSNGKRKPKWVATHLKVEGNKEKAEVILDELKNGDRPLTDLSEILFSDYLLEWLKNVKGTIAVTTYSSYESTVKNIIAPYFDKLRINIRGLSHPQIQRFYEIQLDRHVSPNTVIRYHAIIHRALQHALKRGVIISNPADLAERPRKEVYHASCYSIEEANKLLEVARNSTIALPVILALFYGLRRSEVLGLRWSAIDFDNDTLTINHSVNQSMVDSDYTITAHDRLKKNSSFRTLPLIGVVRDALLLERNKNKSSEYVCTDIKGKLISPNYVTQTFSKLIKKNGLRSIRFHDLRHSCANILISQRVPLIEVQQWLGHSSISTTADLYSHLDYSIKLNSANTIKKN